MPRPSSPTSSPTSTAATARFSGALAIPCPVHDAPAGQPCYELPVGVCAQRIPARDPERTRSHQPSKASRDLAAKQRTRRAEKDAEREQRAQAKRRGTRRAA